MPAVIDGSNSCGRSDNVPRDSELTPEVVLHSVSALAVAVSLSLDNV